MGAAIVTGLVGGLVLPIAKVQALSGSGMLIAGLSAGSETSANAEYVELANGSSSPVTLDGWRLQYRSATGTTWTTKATLAGVLEAGDSLVVASDEYTQTAVSARMASGLAQGGGHIRIVDAASAVQDAVGWGNAIAAEGTPVAAPKTGEVLSRKKDSAGVYLDTDSNTADFEILSASIPIGQSSPGGATPLEAITPETSSANQSPVSPPNLQPDTLTEAMLIAVTELLPNPAAPQTDAADEYVELYNPNDEIVHLTGYKVQSGATYSHSYIFKDETIAAHSYGVFYVRDTKLTLSNSDGRVRLLAPDGSQVDETPAYSGAKDGLAWALIGDTWQWTAQPTPGAANSASSQKDVAGASSASGTAKAASSKSAATAKKASTKAATATAAKKATKAETAKAAVSEAAESVGVHPLVLAVIGTGAVGYAAYEYRQDMANRINQLKRYFRTRREARAKV